MTFIVRSLVRSAAYSRAHTLVADTREGETKSNKSQQFCYAAEPFLRCAWHLAEPTIIFDAWLSFLALICSVLRILWGACEPAIEKGEKEEAGGDKRRPL
jgi:hypothetical protein